MIRIALAILGLTLSFTNVDAQTKKKFAVIAYYAGSDVSKVDRYDMSQLTHVIFSFCHLKGDRLNVDNRADTAMIRKLVSLKKKLPELKVMLSLGGWGGCASCSEVFADSIGRENFSQSVKHLSEYFGTDGIDLDWEYPAIEGYPGHLFQEADRRNFTSLVRSLRNTLGPRYLITFAAGGFNQFIDSAVEWDQLSPLVDYVNIMTYDLVNGYSKTTGHHTGLYSTPSQKESVDNAVTRLVNIGVPASKLVIGAAFYGRMWEGVDSTGRGLYQSGKFKKGVSFSSAQPMFSSKSGFVPYWDSTAHAPYLYSPREKLFMTYENQRSIGEKTAYAMDRGLGGIMFWELTNDIYRDGLLNAIHQVVKKRKQK